MNIEKKWYAVYTRPRWEKKVAELLTKRNIDNYCPLNKVRKQWADRKKMVLEPLFTSYIFVCVAAEDHLQLKKTDGIINIVHWLGKPAIIPDVEIDMIRRFLGEYQQVRLERIAVNLNDMVRIVSGPLMDQGGKITSVSKKSVKVILPSQGYAMIAEVNIENVEVIQNNYSFNRGGGYQYAVQ